MKKLFLILTIIGFILPNIFVVMESLETGNYLFYARPLETFELMFVNNVSSAFATDLLFVVIVFFIWSFSESKKLGIEKYWITWMCTMLFGLAGGWPLFMYMRESKMETSTHHL